MEWQYFVGDCSDPAVQQQAKENFIKGFNEVFAPGDPNYCQREQICTLENIKITCGKVQRRKRRNAQVSKLFLYRQFEPLKTYIIILYIIRIAIDFRAYELDFFFWSLSVLWRF